MSRKKQTFRSVRPVLNRNSFIRLWNNNLSVKELAAFFGVSQSLIRAMAAKYGALSPAARREEQAQEWQPGDPTVDEIRERAEAIKEGWTPAELQARAVYAKPVKWLPPAFSYNSKCGVFCVADAASVE